MGIRVNLTLKETIYLKRDANIILSLIVFYSSSIIDILELISNCYQYLQSYNYVTPD